MLIIQGECLAPLVPFVMALAVADVRKRWCWLSGIAIWYYSIMVLQYYSLVLSFHLFHKFCRIGTTLECSLSMVVEVQHVFF